jgi:hypothetical protein
MTENQTVRMGADAALVLDNPAFKLAMEQIKSAVVEQWKNCSVRDKEGQLLLLQMAKLADRFESMLVGTVEAGKLAQHQINLANLRDESAVKKFARKVVNG